jgi:hypothetical protein
MCKYAECIPQSWWNAGNAFRTEMYSANMRISLIKTNGDNTFSLNHDGFNDLIPWLVATTNDDSQGQTSASRRACCSRRRWSS